MFAVFFKIKYALRNEKGLFLRYVIYGLPLSRKLCAKESQTFFLMQSVEYSYFTRSFDKNHSYSEMREILVI